MGQVAMQAVRPQPSGRCSVTSSYTLELAVIYELGERTLVLPVTDPGALFVSAFPVRPTSPESLPEVVGWRLKSRDLEDDSPDSSGGSKP